MPRIRYSISSKRGRIFVGNKVNISAIKYDYDSETMTAAVLFVIIPGRIVKPTVGDRITITGTSYTWNDETLTAFNDTWLVYSVANDDAYASGSTLVKATRVDTSYAPDLMKAPNTYQIVGGFWAAIPKVTPSSVTFTYNEVLTDPRQKYNVAVINEDVNNNMTYTGNIIMTIPSTTDAYSDIQYGSTLPANNGWAGRNVTLSNITSQLPVANANGTKTILSSSVEPAADGHPAYIKLKFNDTSEVAMRMGSATISGTMALNF